MNAFRDQVLGILQEIHDLGRAADLIAAIHDSVQFNARRQQAQRAAAGRWNAQHGPSQDAQHDAQHPASQGAQHEPKPANSLPAAKQDAQHGFVGGRGGSGFLPFRGPDLSPDPSKPKIGISKRARAREAPPSPAFEAFWALYPRKVGKAAARRVWDRLQPPLDVCQAALAWQTQSHEWTKDGGLYIPHPTTWLNARRWEDERPTTNGYHNGRSRQFVPSADVDYPIGEQKL